MFDTIITKRKRKRQRFVAGILSFVMAFMCLPLNAFAAPNEYDEYDHPLFTWQRTTQNSVTAAPKDTVAAEFDRWRSAFSVVTGESTTIQGHTYHGISSQNPSTLWVMENLLKYMLLCDWACYNMVSTENGSYRYNLFFNNTSGANGGPGAIATDNKWDDIQEEIKLIMEAVKGDSFQKDFPAWGATDASNYIGKLTTMSDYGNVLAKARTASDIRPGSFSSFGSTAQWIWLQYYRVQMAYILGMTKLTDEERAALGDMTKVSNAADVEKAVLEKMKAAKQEVVTTTTVENGEVTTTTEFNYQFSNEFKNDSAMLWGDSTFQLMAKDKGWLKTDSPQYPGGGDLYYSLELGAANPAYVVQEWGGSTPFPTMWQLNNMGGSFSVPDAVKDIYMCVGYDYFATMATQNMDASTDPNGNLYVLEHLGTQQGMAEVQTLLSCIENIPKETQARPADNPLCIRVVAVPLTGDEETDAWITKLNEMIKSTVQLRNEEYQRDDMKTTHGEVHIGYMEMGDVDFADGNDIYRALGEAIYATGQVTVMDSSGNQQTLPNQTGSSGLQTADLMNLYTECGGDLQELLTSYNSIVTFADQLYQYHYDDDPDAPNKDMYGYYYDRLNHVKETLIPLSELMEDIYTQAWKLDAVNVVDPSLPGQVEQDPNKQVENANSALALISNCDIGEDHEITCAGDKPELSGIGYSALAAGVVYDPFVSMEGNESYMAVIHDAIKQDGATDDSLEKIERFLHQALARKKPVYVIDGKRDEWLQGSDVAEAPTGNYRYAYVADLLQGDVNTTRCYTVMKGGMAPSTVDSDTWVYAQGPMTDSEGNAVSDGVTYTTDSHVSGYATPAGSQTMATANEMSAPIMFTSGTTEGFWSGNSAGSGDGFAASLGGLTTVIIHNAAQDAKDNEYIKNAESYMLFMNGLGDIVLADGTIILPAIANPAIYNYDSIQYSVDGSSSLGTAVKGLLVGTAVGAGVIVSAVFTGGVSIPVVLGAVGAVGAGGAVGGIAGAAVQTTGDLFWNENENADIKATYDGTMAYYPYTAAFMNHYPSTSINVEQKLNITNQNDKGKYVIGIDAHGDILARKIIGFNKKTQVNLQYSGGGVTCAPPQPLSFNVESDVTKIGTLLPYYGGEDGDFWSKANTAVKFEFFMCRNGAYNSEDQAFFPLEDSNEAILQESYLNRAGPLMTSAKRFLRERHPTMESTAAHDTFNAERYIMSMAGQGLMGTMYSETLQKNYQISYDELVQDTGNRLLTFFTQLVESAVDTLGNIDGVLAIKNGYENSFFNLLVSFIQEFYAVIAVVLLIIVAVKFLRGHYNMLFVAFIGLMCFCGFEVYANWMPTLVPNIYNFAVNDAVEQIVWNTVAVSAESYSETYRDSARKDPTTGEPKPYTATMTLYKMTRQDMQDMAARLSTTYTDLKKGTIYYLDESAGIFVQGDSIKVSIDKLLVNNSMRGLHQSQWQQLDPEFTDSDGFITPITTDKDMIANPYSVQITNPYVSLEAYYMPFNEIERAFLIQLNKFSSMFRMEHNVFNYGRNLYKDAFLFNCYTNSGIFTAPGNKEVLMENVRIGSIVSRFMDPERAMEDFLYRVYGDPGDKSGAVFPVPEDWLGVAAVFRAPSENFKDSLWGKAMQRKGWYDDNWNITNPDKLNDLIYYMNNQTKQFVIANCDQLNFCSDENAIKIVSMYATTTFTHYVSEFGGWLYPNYVNAADISLKDALYGSMTTLKDRNFSYDGTVVNTVAYNLGVFGVIFILLITVFACVFVFVMTYLVPILYAMFGAIIIFKLINNTNAAGLVKGYVKVTGVTCILYFIFSLSMRLVEVGGYAWYGYLGCALLMFLCCYFLFWVVLSVLQNAGEMGNDVLGQNLLRGLDHITHGAVRKLSANNLTAQRMNQGYGRRGLPFGAGAYEYGRNYGVDSRDYIRGDRSRVTARTSYEQVYDEYGHDSPFEEGDRRRRGFGGREARLEERRTARRFKR